MLTKALVLTDDEANLLSRVLDKVRAKSYQESQISLDNTQALNVLVSYFENVEPEKEARQKPVESFSKRLFLGHVIGRKEHAARPTRGRHERLNRFR
jgi:hypothetical protein